VIKTIFDKTIMVVRLLRLHFIGHVLHKYCLRIWYFFRKVDPFFYRSTYYDISGLSIDLAIQHFHLYGKQEGRISSFFHLLSKLDSWKILSFSNDGYKICNPDIPPNFSRLESLVHYLQYKSKENRSFVPDKMYSRDLQIAILEKVVERPLNNKERILLVDSFNLRNIVTSFYSIFINSESYRKLATDPSIGVFQIMNIVSLRLNRPLNPFELKLYFNKIIMSSEGFKEFWIYLFTAAFKEMNVLKIFLSEKEARTLTTEHLATENIVGINTYQVLLTSAPKTDYLPNLSSQKVSFITSMYNGIEFLPSFLENMTNLVGFKDLCELHIMDANSDQEVWPIIKKYTSSFPNIFYYQLDHRATIYEVWNSLISKCSYDLISNANLDEIKHANFLIDFISFAELNKNVDIFYSDYAYTSKYNPNLFKEIHLGNTNATNLPHCNFVSLNHFNSPHCAPVWRKSLHDQVGFFDTSLISAADWEFWIRCSSAGKKFLKFNEILTAYYFNPNGVSTSTSKGVMEQWPVRKFYIDELIKIYSEIENSLFNRLKSGNIFKDLIIVSESINLK
jgi:hypothetical protein